MGGGDLNLKKSWHTQTLKNIEAVWQAEQKVENERKRMEQLQKELKEERARMEYIKMQEDAGLIKRRGERLDWMYTGSQSAAIIDEEKEAFLLGTKRVDQILKEEQNPLLTKKIPQAEITVSITGITPDNAHRDMQAKIREDPMLAIRLREKQLIDNVLHNPLKIKELRKPQTAASSSDDPKLIRDHQRRGNSRGREETIDQSRRRHRDSRERKHRRHDSRSHSPPRGSRRNGDRYESRHSHHSRPRSKSPARRHREREERHRSRGTERERSRSPVNEYSDRRENNERYRSSPRQRWHVEDEDDEKRRRRKLEEMQQNARQLTIERDQRVKRFLQEEEQESMQMVHGKKMSIKNPAILEQSQGGSSMSRGELHDRLRRKMFTIDRKSARDD